MSSASDVLRGVLTDPDATTNEKINAAKALDAIERRGGGDAGDFQAMTLAEIDAEIARVRALLKG